MQRIYTQIIWLLSQLPLFASWSSLKPFSTPIFNLITVSQPGTNACNSNRSTSSFHSELISNTCIHTYDPQWTMAEAKPPHFPLVHPHFIELISNTTHMVNAQTIPQIRNKHVYFMLWMLLKHFDYLRPCSTHSR